MHWPINVVTIVRGVGVRTKIVTQGLIPFQTYYTHTQTSVLPTPQKAQPQPSLFVNSGTGEASICNTAELHSSKSMGNAE